MNLVKIESAERAASLRSEYYEGLESPVDGFWQYVAIGGADLHEMVVEGGPAGYVTIGKDRRLLQFLPSGDWMARSATLFRDLLGSGLVGSATVSTREPLFLSLCFDHKAVFSVDCLLFEAGEGLVARGEDPSARPLEPATLADIAEIRAGFEPAFDGYYEELVAQEGLFVARDGSGILGIGEMRILPTQCARYADLGMQVLASRRGEGLGSSIARALGLKALARGSRPLACCNVENQASRRALVKAGFLARHRLVNAEFAQRGGEA